MGHWSTKKNCKKYWKKHLSGELHTKKVQFAPGAANHTFFWLTLHEILMSILQRSGNEKQWEYLIHIWSEKGNHRTTVNRALPSFHEQSVQIMLKVPLSSWDKKYVIFNQKFLFWIISVRSILGKLFHKIMIIIIVMFMYRIKKDILRAKHPIQP